MASESDQDPKSTLDESGLSPDLLRKLPFDVLEQIIIDLPFDTIIALIRTGEAHVIECIKWSAPYKRIFRDLHTPKELEAVANVIALCYEVSVYRYHTDEICSTYRRAARAWQRSADHHDTHAICSDGIEKITCTGLSQLPYPRGSVRGARWNRTMLYEGTAQPPEVPYSLDRYSHQYLDDPWYLRSSRVTERTTHEWRWPMLFNRIQHVLHMRLGSIGQWGLPAHSRALFHSLDAAILLPRKRDVVVMNTLVSPNVEAFVSGIQHVPEAAIDRLLAPCKEILRAVNDFEYFTFPKWNQKEICSKPMSDLEDVFLNEIQDYFIRSIVSGFAIKKLEEHMHTVLRQAPASSYWFFYDYFAPYTTLPTHLQGVMWCDKDYRLRDDGQFWWDNLQVVFRAMRSTQLIKLADTFDKHPYMVIMDRDPGSEARPNFSHIKRTMLSIAKKGLHHDPFGLMRHREARYLMRCAGLPLVPLQKHLSFFIDMLTIHPIDLSSISDPAILHQILTESANIEQKFGLSRLTCGTVPSQVNGDEGDSMAVATLPSVAADQCKHIDHQGIGQSYDNEMLQHILTVLHGLPHVSRMGLRLVPLERSRADHTNPDLVLTRWRDREEEDIKFSIPEMGEPLHNMDIAWLDAFLYCCDVFRKQMLTTDDVGNKWDESLFAPAIISAEQKELIKKGRIERKLERLKRRQIRKERKPRR